MLLAKKREKGRMPSLAISCFTVEVSGSAREALAARIRLTFGCSKSHHYDVAKDGKRDDARHDPWGHLVPKHFFKEYSGHVEICTQYPILRNCTQLHGRKRPTPGETRHLLTYATLAKMKRMAIMIMVAMVAFANLFFGRETSLKTWDKRSAPHHTNKAQRNQSYIKWLLESGVAVYDIDDGACIASKIATGSNKRLVGVEVRLDCGLADGTIAKIGAASDCEADDDDGKQSQDFDQGQNVVENDTAVAPKTVDQASTSQCRDGDSTNGVRAVGSASGLHDVLAHCNCISSQVAEDDEDDTVDARCLESRVLIDVLQLQPVNALRRTSNGWKLPT